jgi:hypothetical protein
MLASHRTPTHSKLPHWTQATGWIIGACRCTPALPHRPISPPRRASPAPLVFPADERPKAASASSHSGACPIDWMSLTPPWVMPALHHGRRIHEPAKWRKSGYASTIVHPRATEMWCKLGYARQTAPLHHKQESGADWCMPWRLVHATREGWWKSGYVRQIGPATVRGVVRSGVYLADWYVPNTQNVVRLPVVVIVVPPNTGGSSRRRPTSRRHAIQARIHSPAPCRPRFVMHPVTVLPLTARARRWYTREAPCGKTTSAGTTRGRRRLSRISSCAAAGWRRPAHPHQTQYPAPGTGVFVLPAIRQST